MPGIWEIRGETDEGTVPRLLRVAGVEPIGFGEDLNRRTVIGAVAAGLFVTAAGKGAFDDGEEKESPKGNKKNKDELKKKDC